MSGNQKFGKGKNKALECQSISAPGFRITQGSVSISAPIKTTVTPTTDDSIVNKAYVDSISGSASNLQEAYEGGSTIDIDTATIGQFSARDSGSSPVFTIGEVDVQLAQPLSLSSVFKITDLATPTLVGDLSTKLYVDDTISILNTLQDVYDGGNTIDINTGVSGNLIFRDSGSSAVMTVSETEILMATDLDMGSTNKATALDAPTDPDDGVTKTYVDGAYTATNVGSAAGEVFRDTTGTTSVNFRTLASADNVTVANAGDTVTLTWGGIGKQIIDASTFAGATADVKINAALATADDGAIIIVDRGFGPTETIADQITFPSKNALTLIFGKIDFTYTNASSGGTAPGTAVKLFNIPAQMEYLTIKGAGSGTETTANPSNPGALTSFTWDAGAGNSYVMNFEDGHYLTLQDMKFVGKNQGVGASGAISSSTNVTNGTQGFNLNNIHMDFMTRTMINLTTPLYCRWSRVTLTRGGTSGFFISSGTTNIFENCYCHSFFDSGFRIQGTSYSSLMNCKANECGVGFLIRQTKGIGLWSCSATDTQFRDATYPGYGLQVTATAEGTTAYNFYATGFDDNVNQRFIDIDDSINTTIFRPKFTVDSTFTPTDAIVVDAAALGATIVIDSTNLKLPENGANTNMLLNNSATDLQLVYDGYLVNYGTRQEGPVFHDTSGGFKFVQSDAAGVVSGQAWTPP